MPLKARLIHKVGVRATARTYWGKDCPNCLGKGNPGYHNAHRFLMDLMKPREGYLHIDNDFCGGAKDYPEWAFPQKCDHCGAEVPKDLPRSPPSPTCVEDSTAKNGYREIETVHLQIFYHTLYNTDSGHPEPGDLYWADWYSRDETRKCFMHDNCDGTHLMAILPNGHEWDIDGRASNCTMKHERLHRCWVRCGEPPHVHVDKNGHTCAAGAGSISVTGYHGFLHNGFFTDG